MNKVLWVVSLKARILEGSPLDMDGSEFTFGEAATFSHSEIDVKEQLLQKMNDGKLELLELFHITPADKASWISQSEDMEDILELIEQVKITGKFAFGLFRSSEYLEASYQ